MRKLRHNPCIAAVSIFLVFQIVLSAILVIFQPKLVGASGNTANNSNYENIIAITFDDGPNEKTTKKLLDGLKERGVKASFFVVGENAVKNPDIIRQMSLDGHLIGNHTYTHVQLTKMSDNKALQEITMTNKCIEEITKYKPKYIRPPYGAYSSKLLFEVNMSPVFWNVDSNDWKTFDVGVVVQRVVSQVKPGDIILMHDIYDTSVAAALEIIDRLQDKGYIFVTVDQLILD